MRDLTEQDSVLFKRLTKTEIKAYKKWARDNYEQRKDPSLALFHPIIRQEFATIELENQWIKKAGDK